MENAVPRKYLPKIFVDRGKWIDYKESEGPKPFPIKSDSWNRSDSTLFVMIASFRDRLCPVTLFNIFTKAKYPKRIHVGIVQQNTATDIDCLIEYCNLMKNRRRALSVSDSCPFETNIRIRRVDAARAKGPTWARAIGSSLLQDEEFCMQTDAHMDFVTHWDVKMMQMWSDTRNEYGILSTYVAPTDQMEASENGKGLNELHEVPHLCMVTLHGANDMIRVWGTKCARMLPRPKLTNAIWGAGLSFSKCHAERKAPYDPHTPYIFDGEEFSRAIRFWTWGYDIYTPHRTYVLHNYQDSQSDPTHGGWWASNGDDGIKEARKVAPGIFSGDSGGSAKRLKMLIGLPTDVDGRNESVALALRQSRYGLGDRRSLQQAVNFSGIDTFNRKILANRCGNLDFVPFEEHPWGADYIPSYDKSSERFTDVRDPGSIYFDAADSGMVAKWNAVDTGRRGSHVSAVVIKPGNRHSIKARVEPVMQGDPGHHDPLLLLRSLNTEAVKYSEGGGTVWLSLLLLLFVAVTSVLGTLAFRRFVMRWSKQERLARKRTQHAKLGTATLVEDAKILSAFGGGYLDSQSSINRTGPSLKDK